MYDKTLMILRPREIDDIKFTVKESEPLGIGYKIGAL